MAVRARSFAARLKSDFDIDIQYRSSGKVGAILRFFVRAVRLRPALCYVFDMSFSGVIAAGLYRSLTRCRVITDTGDAIYELSRSGGTRGRFGLWLTKLLERYGFAISDGIVVRSHFHQEWLAARGIDSHPIPDGVDTAQFRPSIETELRRQYGLDGVVVIGLLGSLIWNARLKMCYGWELIELIHRLKDKPVKGVIIGDGAGMSHLKEQVTAYGLEDRIVFLGRIPYDGLPRMLNLMDICLSTQTNDIAGQVRTTGKLPLYLACGRFVLSSAVGEAARVLPSDMLVPYNGTKDVEYPARLAERVIELLVCPDRMRQSQTAVGIAKTHFDYGLLTSRLKEAIRAVLAPPSP